MPDKKDSNHTHSPDNLRINRNEEYELRDWSKNFGCTQEQLIACIDETGSTYAAEVRECLKAKGQLKR